MQRERGGEQGGRGEGRSGGGERTRGKPAKGVAGGRGPGLARVSAPRHVAPRPASVCPPDQWAWSGRRLTPSETCSVLTGAQTISLPRTPGLTGMQIPLASHLGSALRETHLAPPRT